MLSDREAINSSSASTSKPLIENPMVYSNGPPPTHISNTRYLGYIEKKKPLTRIRLRERRHSQCFKISSGTTWLSSLVLPSFLFLLSHPLVKDSVLSVVSLLIHNVEES
jgi:hypothetical protein